MAFEEELHKATTACLQQAAADNYKSIALPLISDGQSGGPVESAARAMGQAIAQFVDSMNGNKLQVTTI